MADQVVQDIKDRLNVVEVIGSYITVKKSGATHKAVCPFHNERSASLMVSESKQIWHCFGCGEGGDVFGFVMRYEGVEFREALELLAMRAGVVLPEYNGSASSGGLLGAKTSAENEKELLRINAFAAEVYHRNLMQQDSAKVARDYLTGRGLSEQTLEKWRIGFAPDSYDFLQKALAAKKIAFDRMSAAGVASRSERGQTYDRFRNRITFPIHNYRGEVVGFSARILPGNDSDTAKYVNSPETVIYNKSKILFGLNFAKEAIRKKNEVVIVEGQMDCISAHQADFANTVASSGTALTEDHLRLLGRFTKNLKFCFDADTAGQAATQRAGQLALQLGFSVKIIVLKQVKDPDELIRSSPALWQKAITEAYWFIDYYLNKAADQFENGSIEQKKFLNETVIPLLTYIGDPVEQDHYVKQLSQKFNISERVVRDMANKKPGSSFGDPQISKPAQFSPAQTNPGIELNTTEKQVLGGLLAFPEFLAQAQIDGLDKNAFSSALQPLVTQALAGTLTAQNAKETLAKEAVFMVESGLDQVIGDRSIYLRDLQKSANLIRLTYLKKQLQDITVQMSRAEQTGDSEKLSEYNRRFASLTAARTQLENQL